MEFRCPKCEALLHSRRTRLCGICGAVIPEELRLTDEEARLRDQEQAQERSDAQKLADAFDPRPPVARHQSHLQTTLSAAELIARAETGDLSIGGDFSVQFKHRKRKWFWVSGVALCLFLIPVIALASKTGKSMTSALVASGIVIAFTVLRSWSKAAPICPHCHQNIRFCVPDHCHLCGDPLSDKRCNHCNVNHSWMGKLRPHSHGLSDWIIYCPGCGVYLDTDIKRWGIHNNNG